MSIYNSITNDNLEWNCSDHGNFKIYQSGSHKDGNYIQVYAPKQLPTDSNKVKAVVYLHGFALCTPKFYEAHLEELVNQGYIVFFPDYQHSTYSDHDSLPPESEKLISSINWFEVIFKNISQLQEEKESKRLFVPKSVSRLNRLKFVRTAIALFIVVRLAYLVYFVLNREYTKDLVRIISTVGWSLFFSPQDWIKMAINRTEQGWEKLCQDYPGLETKDLYFYTFGHSLGGLLALSWPTYLSPEQQTFQPKQILSADPAPKSNMGIPSFITPFLKLLGSPSVTETISINKVGKNLEVPVAILHGADDKIVRPKEWVKAGLFQSKPLFDYIDTERKKIYFSESNPKENLEARHNQAVTNTYFGKLFFKQFGGVKNAPDAYNHEFIWPGLDLVIKEEVKADELLNRFPLQHIAVTESLPRKKLTLSKIIKVIFVLITLSSLGYLLRQFAGT